jgi:hypothetical protein
MIKSKKALAEKKIKSWVDKLNKITREEDILIKAYQVTGNERFRARLKAL